MIIIISLLSSSSSSSLLLLLLLLSLLLYKYINFWPTNPEVNISLSARQNKLGVTLWGWHGFLSDLHIVARVVIAGSTHTFPRKACKK